MEKALKKTKRQTKYESKKTYKKNRLQLNNN